MKNIIFVVTLATVVLIVNPTKTISQEAVKAPVEPKTATTAELIAFYADKYHVSEKTMNRVIKCESNFDPKSVGDHGHSYGLVQIHLPSNKQITKAQALDKKFAIEFLAKGLANHQGKKWTCWRNLS